MASFKHTLEIMQQCFPEWTDARKRPQKSTSGNWLMSYAREADYLQEAIEEYQKMFFLLNYNGHENEIVDYLYTGLIGNHENVSITSINCQVTTNVDVFYSNLDKYCLYQSPIIYFHEKLLPLNTSSIEYLAGENLYRVQLTKEHIWNVFDEFAKFAGIERYNNETNKELSVRTYNQFTRFSNASENGLKNAIQNALSNDIEISANEIEILPFSSSQIDYASEDYKKIYEDFLNFNKDVFRAKVWDQSYWENSFQKTDYLPHPWNASLEAFQDGTGSLKDLHIDFVKNIGADSTNVTIKAYKQSLEAINEYVSKNDITINIPLTLTKYSNEINPINIEYKINAYDVQKIDPYSIYLMTKRARYGKNIVPIEDIAIDIENIVCVNQNKLNKNSTYRLAFTPKSPMSSMEIKSCDLIWQDGKRDLRQEKNNYLLKNNILVNKDVYAHITFIGEADYTKNIEDTLEGMTVEPSQNEGVIGVNISGMQNQLLEYQIDCNLVDITGNPEIKTYGSFYFDKTTNTYLSNSTVIEEQEPNIDDNPSEITDGSIIMEFYCNKYSFEFLQNEIADFQGTISVTIFIDGKTIKNTYTEAAIISDSFTELKNIKIIVQRVGQNTVQIGSVKICAYETELYLDSGNLIQTSMYTRLPNFSGNNMLYIKLTPITSSFPVIKYIHIGNSLQGASYHLTFTTANLNDPSLYIRTNCNVDLYELQGNKEILITENYSTSSVYRNTTQERGIILLNMENFNKITFSSPKIGERYINGEMRSYIEIEPNQSLQDIIIIGERLDTITSKSLASIIIPDDNKEYEIYVTNKDIHAVVLKNIENNQTRLTGVNWSDIGIGADLFYISGLPNDIGADYIYNNPEVQISHFDKLSFYLNKSKQYVAYNSVNMIQYHQDDVAISNTFLPAISLNSHLFYSIDNPINSENDVSFMDGRKWSLGVQNLSIDCNVDILQAQTYQSDILHVNNIYKLSTNIPLNRYVLIDNIEHQIREYLLNPPENMEIDYVDEITYEDAFISDKILHYKLSCSNVKNLTVIMENQTYNYGFSLLQDEGIVIFSDKRFLNHNVRLRYTVSSPTSIHYKDWHDLYNIANYQVDAYAQADETIFYNMTENDTRELKFNDDIIKYVITTDNPAFQAVVQNNHINVIKIAESDKLAIHNGYIYDGGREYYKFSDKREEQLTQLQGMTLENITRQGNLFLTHIESINYLSHSDMNGLDFKKSCEVDLINHASFNGNKFNHLTACDTYGIWYPINMNIEIISKAKNGYGTRLTSKDNDFGYAIIDISNYLIPGNILSIWQKGDLKAYIAPEILINNLPLHKSVYVSLEDAIQLEKYNEYYYYIINKDYISLNKRTYLILEGTNGIIDDITTNVYTSLNDIESYHIKNIDFLGFNIEEKVMVDTIINLSFDPTGASYMDATIDPDTKAISSSANIEYGLTKIKEIALNNCRLSGVNIIQDKLVYKTNKGFIRTQSFYISQNNAIYELYVKINDLIVDKYDDFTIKLYGSSSSGTTYSFISEAKNTNFISLPQNKIPAYMYIEAYNKSGYIINSIEVYAKYAETNFVTLTSEKHSQCSFTTKLYDLGVKANYEIFKINAVVNGSLNKVSYQVRGCRFDEKNAVFTTWKPIMLKETILEDYRFIQFKIIINDPNTSVILNSFDLKVID